MLELGGEVGEVVKVRVGLKKVGAVQRSMGESVVGKEEQEKT